VDAAIMSSERNTGQLLLTVTGLARCAAVSVVPQGLYRTAVAAGTGPAPAAYDVDAATMHMGKHSGIN
jgi:hypothetical protein